MSIKNWLPFCFNCIYRCLWDQFVVVGKASIFMSLFGIRIKNRKAGGHLYYNISWQLTIFDLKLYLITVIELE